MRALPRRAHARNVLFQRLDLGEESLFFGAHPDHPIGIARKLMDPRVRVDVDLAILAFEGSLTSVDKRSPVPASRLVRVAAFHGEGVGPKLHDVLRRIVVVAHPSSTLSSPSSAGKVASAAARSDGSSPRMMLAATIAAATPDASPGAESR